MATVLSASQGLLCCAAQQPNVGVASSGGQVDANNVVLIPGPRGDVECPTPGLAALTWEKSSTGELNPKAVESRPANWDAPTRSQVELEGGALVAVDQGEFAESGLYWLADGTETLQPVEVPSVVPIRQVLQTSDGTVGVAGLCHGSGPFMTTLVALLPTSIPTKWNAQTIAHVRGCPAAVQLNPYDSSVVVATAQGEGLVSASDSKTTVIATWPAQYQPKELHVSTLEGSGAAEFYVGFGRVLAVFRGGESAWYTLRGCVDASSK